MFININSSDALAESKWDQSDVPLNKAWTIKFNSSVNPSTCNENTIKLGYYDRKGELIYQENALKVYSTGANVCRAEKVNGEYLADSMYVLLINQGVRGINGNSLKEEVKMEFKTVARYSIGFKDGLTMTEKNVIIQELDGGEIIRADDNVYIVTLTESALKILQQNENVKYIEKDVLVEPTAKNEESRH